MDPSEETEEFYDCPDVCNVEICGVEDYDQTWAKEKASILWLLSKAYGGVIPNDLKEPFYRDADHVRRLKPNIVHSLANAELYCLALVNIYSDPNYHNLDHQGIIQALMRKGICLVESREAPLTETVLVQTAPIRLHSHMAVIDGMMSLYIKEVLIPEKIVQAVREFSFVDVNSEMPSNPEEAAVLWINKCCVTLDHEIRSQFTAEEECHLPKIPVLQEISDISDGCSLAAVLSYYCPNYVRWQDICWNDPMSLADSVYNLQIIKKFCYECLPHNINFLTLEDFLYLHPSIKDNILVFVADLLYMFVIWKVNCVSRGKKNVPLESSQNPLESSKSLGNFPTPKSTQQVPCSPIPNLRSDSYGGSTTSLPDIRPRSRSRIYGSKESLTEKLIISKKSSSPNDEAISNRSQRTPSNVVNGWKMNSTSNLASVEPISGSPKHSISCTINNGVRSENPDVETASTPKSTSKEQSFARFTSPQAKLNSDQSQVEKTSHSTQNVQKEPINYGFRKFSEDLSPGFRAMGDGQTNFGKGLLKGRKSLEDYYNQLAKGDGPLRSVSASNIIDSKNKRKAIHEKYPTKSRGDESVPESASSHSSGICLSDVDHKNLFSTTSFAELSKLRDTSNSSINIIYMQHEKEGPELEKTSLKSTFLQGKKAQTEGKKTTFAALPNTTTWQQQHAVHTNSPQSDSGHETPTDNADNLLNSQLYNVRMKLEDKKRKIELKKKRMELLWKKQRQKVGKAAFLQAVSKGGGSDAGTPDSGTEKDDSEVTEVHVPVAPAHTTPSLVKRMSMQDIAEDLDNVQKKWLAQNEALKRDSTSDLTLDTTDGEHEASSIDFQKSIAHLNMSLTDLQDDISRISLQQEQVESLMKDSVDDASHFFLHSRNELQTQSPPTQSNFNFEGSYIQRHEPKHMPASSQHAPTSSKLNILDVQMPLSSLPINSNTQPKEELYSKVIKPENRQKSRYLNNRPALASPTKASSKFPENFELKGTSYDLCKGEGRQELPRQEFLPQLPEKSHKANLKKTKDTEQGFYISLEKEPKRTKPRMIRNGKVEHAKSESNGPKAETVSVPKTSAHEGEVNSLGFVIGADLVHPDPEAENEMARKKEMIMHLSIQRKAEFERRRIEKERELANIKEEERRKQEYHERRREEEKRRREYILEQYRLRKMQEELEKDDISHMGGKDSGKMFTKPRMSVRQVKKKDNRIRSDFTKPVVNLQNHLTSLKQPRRETKPRPRSAYIPTTTDPASLSSMDFSAANKRNSQLIYSGREPHEFDLDSLNSNSTTVSSRDQTRSPNGTHHHHQLLLPQRGPDGPSSDGASDTASNGSSAADYTGPKLFVKPAAKSNRGIITNAINTVLAGAVNADGKKKVLEEINRSESKHFLILFRDAGCQFRALYSYNPDREEVTKLYGIGPKSVTDKMMDRFYKYNSGGKCFSEIQTKHLTVTIDAFTIPNSLWAGKKNILPRKEFF